MSPKPPGEAHTRLPLQAESPVCNTDLAGPGKAGTHVNATGVSSLPAQVSERLPHHNPRSLCGTTLEEVRTPNQGLKRF